MDDDIAQRISTDPNDNAYITGWYTSSVITFGSTTFNDPGNNENAFVAKLGSNISSGILMFPDPGNTITVYPNPTTGNIYFNGVQTGYTLQVYDVLGEMISSSTVDRDNYAVNLSGKAKGMYFYRVENGGVLVGQGKVVLE